MDAPKHNPRDLLKELSLENQGQKFSWAALISISTLLLTTELAFLFPKTIPETDQFKTTGFIVLGGLTTSLLSFLLIRWFFNQKKHGTAQHLDQIYRAQNRMEAAAELQDTSHVLKDAQLKDAARFFSTIQPSSWPLWRTSFITLLITLLLLQSTLLVSNYQRSKIAQEAEQLLANQQKRAKPQFKKPDFAELRLTSPQSDIRATPIDEVTWSGEGGSTQGFDDIHLEISVNGTTHTQKFINEAPLKKQGNLAFKDSLLLDELNVVPFDVITYSLKGTATLDGKPNQEITSLPQFIQVRPVREDAKIEEGKDGEGSAAVNELLRMLQIQLSLTKATYAAKATRLSFDNPDFKKGMSQLVEEQEILSKELKAFEKSTPAELMSVTMSEGVHLAEEGMDEALNHLTGKPAPPPNLSEAGISQQKAVAGLVAAMKEVQKILADSKGSGKSKKNEDPFKDRQDYQRPKMDPELNPEKQLSNLLKEEEEISKNLAGQENQKSSESKNDPSTPQGNQQNDQAKNDAQGEQPSQGSESGSSPQNQSAANGQAEKRGPQNEMPTSLSELKERQNKVTQKLNDLASNQNLDPSLQPAIQRAAEASEETQKEISSNNREAATTAAQKTTADIQGALTKLRKLSEEKTEQAMNHAQKELNEAKRDLDASQIADAAKNIQDALDKIETEAKKQHLGGKQNLAEQLAKLAEEVEKKKTIEDLKNLSQNPNPSKQEAMAQQIEKLRERISATEMENKNKPAELARALKNLESLEKQLEKAEKSSDSSKSGGEKTNTDHALKEIEVASQNISELMKEDASDGAQNYSKVIEKLASSLVVHRSPAEMKKLRNDIRDLKVSLRQTIDKMESQNLTRTFNPEEVPEAYREDVSVYFQKLSSQKKP